MKDLLKKANENYPIGTTIKCACDGEIELLEEKYNKREEKQKRLADKIELMKKQNAQNDLFLKLRDRSNYSITDLIELYSILGVDYETFDRIIITASKNISARGFYNLVSCGIINTEF